MRGQAHGFAGHHFIDPLHFVEDAARSHHGNPEFWCTFSLAHTGFLGLFRDRLVRKDANPNLAATLYMARHGDTPGLNLSVCKPARLKCFEPKTPIVEARPAVRDA